MYEIYSKDDCIYCTQAKELLSRRNIPFTEFKIDRELTREEFMEQFPGWTKMPMIMHDSVRIGGFTELKEYLKG